MPFDYWPRGKVHPVRLQLFIFSHAIMLRAPSFPASRSRHPKTNRSVMIHHNVRVTEPREIPRSFDDVASWKRHREQAAMHLQREERELRRKCGRT